MTYNYTPTFCHTSEPYPRATTVYDFDGQTMTVPADWNSDAARILHSLYARKAIPARTAERPGYEHLPEPLRPSIAIGDDRRAENSYEEIFDRVAGGLAFGAIEHGILDAKSALAFYHDLRYLMAHQTILLNSPQQFNGGIWWAYGTEGPDVDLFARDPISGTIVKSANTFRHPQLSACFILSLTDSLTGENGILDWYTRELRIFKGGSGSGTYLGNLRSANEPLSRGGTSSGMLSFARPADSIAGTTKSAGENRRAAKMHVAPYDHPESLDFITLKAREEQKVAALVSGSALLLHESDHDDLTRRVAHGLTLAAGAGADLGLGLLDTNYLGEAYRTVTGQNANNSVLWDAPFFEALDSDANVDLRRITDGAVARTIPAEQLWRTAAAAAWFVGDPGYLFRDTINAWHTTPSYGDIHASNPCGEYLSNDDTSCNLGTLNLTAFLDGPTLERFNTQRFTQAARLLTLALDITVSVSGYPDHAIAQRTNELRNLGANYTNLGALLMLTGLPYDDLRSRSVAAAITSLLTATVYATSAELASTVGVCDAYRTNATAAMRVIRMHATAAGVIDPHTQTTALPANTVTLNSHLVPHHIADAIHAAWGDALHLANSYGLRNMQATVAAPTGSVSFGLGATTFGIEPNYALTKMKHLADGSSITLADPNVAIALERLGYEQTTRQAILDYIAETGTAVEAPGLKTEHEPIFRTATGPNAISPNGHIDMIAAIQPHLSGGISKTINLPNDVSIETIATHALSAYRKGIKGCTFFRDGSKLFQPLVRTGTTKLTCPNCKTQNVVPTGACAVCTNCQKQIGGC